MSSDKWKDLRLFTDPSSYCLKVRHPKCLKGRLCMVTIRGEGCLLPAPAVCICEMYRMNCLPSKSHINLDTNIGVKNQQCELLKICRGPKEVYLVVRIMHALLRALYKRHTRLK